ncbi:UNVERIFIED_CONTAM: hypothetical protein Sradi_0734600 [Sesamum radiatum]|uniref:Uncharacterized protein n=1 Tax=Sesamum radiatum TaxID=300843 RepID=A0AAW2VRV8_SESRA
MVGNYNGKLTETPSSSLTIEPRPPSMPNTPSGPWNADGTTSSGASTSCIA